MSILTFRITFICREYVPAWYPTRIVACAPCGLPCSPGQVTYHPQGPARVGTGTLKGPLVRWYERIVTGRSVTICPVGPGGRGRPGRLRPMIVRCPHRGGRHGAPPAPPVVAPRSAAEDRGDQAAQPVVRPVARREQHHGEQDQAGDQGRGGPPVQDQFDGQVVRAADRYGLRVNGRPGSWKR